MYKHGRYTHINTRATWLVLILSLTAFSALLCATLLHSPVLTHLDNTINALVPGVHNPLTDPLMYYISEVFEPKLFVLWFIPLLLLLAYKGAWYRAAFLFFGVGGGQVVKTIIKHITDKPRPQNPFGIIDSESSFPSGHSVAAVFIFLEIYFFIIPLLKPSWQAPARVVTIAAAILVPLSRVYLQVHYLSDIIAGSLLAVASLAATMLIFSHAQRIINSQTKAYEQV